MWSTAAMMAMSAGSIRPDDLLGRAPGQRPRPTNAAEPRGATIRDDFMIFSSLLAPSAVKVLSDVSSKKRLLQAIADLAATQVDVPAARVFEALQERESLGPTGVGHGIALPHARLPDMEGVRGVFVRLERPIDFDAADRQPVDLVFALLAPVDSGVDHLKALALVSRTLRDAALCTKLRANSDPTKLHALLTAAESTQAA